MTKTDSLPYTGQSVLTGWIWNQNLARKKMVKKKSKKLWPKELCRLMWPFAPLSSVNSTMQLMVVSASTKNALVKITKLWKKLIRAGFRLIRSTSKVALANGLNPSTANGSARAYSFTTIWRCSKISREFFYENDSWFVPIYPNFRSRFCQTRLRTFLTWQEWELNRQHQRQH